MTFEQRALAAIIGVMAIILVLCFLNGLGRVFTPSKQYWNGDTMHNGGFILTGMLIAGSLCGVVVVLHVISEVVFAVTRSLNIVLP